MEDKGVTMPELKEDKGVGCQKCNWTGYIQGISNKIPVACLECKVCILCKGIGTIINLGNQIVPCTVCKKKEVKETINHPLHYGGDVVYEAIKVIEAWGLDFCLGNTVKYISRAGKKTTVVNDDAMIEDLRKARWYLNRRIDQLLKEKENGS